MLEHFVFGSLIKTEKEPDIKFLENIIKQTLTKRQELSDIGVDNIIEVLDRAGRLWSDPGYRGRVNALDWMPQIVGFDEKMVNEAINSMCEMLTRKHLELKIKRAFGQKGCLDNYKFDYKLGCFIKAEPVGTVLHVSPGNVFVGCIDSLINGLITKNINIIKMASIDPIFPLLFANSLLEVDPDRVICDKFALLTFHGGQKIIEDYLKANCDGILIWGNSDVVNSYRKTTPSKCKLIEYGPRIGVVVITKHGFKECNLKDLATGLSRDIAYWEQRACSSPQIIYFENPTDNDIDKLCSELEGALKDAASVLPCAEISENEKVEITKERNLSKIDSSRGLAKVYIAENLRDYTIIFTKNSDFTASPLNRFIIIKPYKDLMHLESVLMPHSSYLQSAGLLSSKSEMEEVTKTLNFAGIKRVSPAGKMHLGIGGAPHEGGFEVLRLSNLVTIENKPKEFSNNVSEKKLCNKLKAIVEYVKINSPFYNNYYNGKTIESLRDFEAIPTLKRELLYNNTPPEGTDLLTGNPENCIVFASGGTTGNPKFIIYTHDEWDEITRQSAFVYSLAGIEKSDRVANLFMAGNMWSSFVAVNDILRTIGSTVYPIAGNADESTILSYIEKLRPNVLVGLPSVIIEIAEKIYKQKIKGYKIEKILYGGEMLTRGAYNFLHDKLSVKSIMSAGYASVDAGMIGYQCDKCEGSIHHLLSDYQYIEILDPVSDTSVPKGNYGEICATNLKRWLMPVIRYRTGDKGRMVDSFCPCGRKDPLFELKGRIDDVIRVGTVSIYPDGFEPFFTGDQNLTLNFQIQAYNTKNRDFLRVLIEESQKLPEKEREKLSATLTKNILVHYTELAEALEKNWLGGFEVVVVGNGEIPRIERTQKLKKVVDLR